MRVKTATINGFTFHVSLHTSEAGTFCQIWCDQAIGTAETEVFPTAALAELNANTIAIAWSLQLAGEQSPAGAQS